MAIWQAFVLGFTQGLTEFLPVSSSGHLVFLQRVLGVDIGGAEMLFNIILHLGTLVAVCVIFWKDILNLFTKPYKRLFCLAVATAPAAIGGLLLEDLIDGYVVRGRYTGILLAAFFTLTAILLFAAETYAKRRKTVRPLGVKTSLTMGCAQLVALLPGISRSGSTIAAGTFAGGSSEELSKFSFLMSIPVILGSFMLSLVKGVVSGELSLSVAAAGERFGWCIAIGFIISALAGLFAIRVMLRAIKRAEYKWFSLYLILLAIACIICQHFGLFN